MKIEIGKCYVDTWGYVVKITERTIRGRCLCKIFTPHKEVYSNCTSAGSYSICKRCPSNYKKYNKQTHNYFVYGCRDIATLEKKVPKLKAKLLYE